MFKPPVTPLARSRRQSARSAPVELHPLRQLWHVVRTMRGTVARVSIQHSAINSGSELFLDESIGLVEVTLNHELEALGKAPDDLRDLWGERLPDDLSITTCGTTLEFVRLMNVVRKAKTPILLRVVWARWEFEERCRVSQVLPPVSVAGGAHMGFVTLARPQRRAGF